MRIYLDQNQLMKIFWASQGDKRGELYKDTLNLINKSIEEKRAIYPISCLHIVETAKYQNEKEKEKLSRFLFKISNGYGILPFYSVIGSEVKNAMAKRTNKSDEIVNIDEIIVKKQGMLYAFGCNLAEPTGNRTFDEILESNLNNEQTYWDFIRTITDEQIGEMKNQDIKNAEIFQKEREKIFGMDPKDAAKLIIVDIFDIIIPIIKENCVNLGIIEKDFSDIYLSDETSIIKFFNEITTMDVFSNFLLKRDLGNKPRVHENDVFDMGFLATAIHHCDIVVTEGYWKSLYQQTGLNKKYKTRVLDDVRELENVLE